MFFLNPQNPKTFVYACMTCQQLFRFQLKYMPSYNMWQKYTKLGMHLFLLVGHFMQNRIKFDKAVIFNLMHLTSNYTRIILIIATTIIDLTLI